MRSKHWQRLIGLALVAACGGGTLYVWHVAMSQHRYSLFTAALLPMFAVLGLALLLFPLDFARLRYEAGFDDAPFLRRLPVVWQLLTLAAVLAGLANWYAIVFSV